MFLTATIYDVDMRVFNLGTGEEVYEPGIAASAKQAFDRAFESADREYEKAQAGQGDRAVAYRLMQEALRTAERGVDSEVQGYLATTAILTSSLLEALDR